MGDIRRPLRHVAGDQFAKLVEAYLQLAHTDSASSMRTGRSAASSAVEKYNFANADRLRKLPREEPALGWLRVSAAALRELSHAKCSSGRIHVFLSSPWVCRRIRAMNDGEPEFRRVDIKKMIGCLVLTLK